MQHALTHRPPTDFKEYQTLPLPPCDTFTIKTEPSGRFTLEHTSAYGEPNLELVTITLKLRGRIRYSKGKLQTLYIVNAWPVNDCVTWKDFGEMVMRRSGGADVGEVQGSQINEKARGQSN